MEESDAAELDALLRRLDEAADEANWAEVSELADQVLAADPGNEDARLLARVSARRLDSVFAPMMSATEMSER